MQPPGASTHCTPGVLPALQCAHWNRVRPVRARIELRVALLLVAEAPDDDARVGAVVLDQRAELVHAADVEIPSLVPHLRAGRQRKDHVSDSEDASQTRKTTSVTDEDATSASQVFLGRAV